MFCIVQASTNGKEEQQMKMATVHIPRKFKNGSSQVRNWIENYTQSVGRPVEIATGTQSHTSEVFIAKTDNLNEADLLALANALFILNSRIFNPITRNDSWKGRTEADQDHESRLLELEKAF